jgi:hypothetical protein
MILMNPILNTGEEYDFRMDQQPVEVEKLGKIGADNSAGSVAGSGTV